MRVAVVGAGAIGGFVAGALARSGTEVAVVARGEHLRAIRDRGLRIRSELGEFCVELPASSDLRDHGTVDVVLVALKAHQWQPVLEQFAQAAASQTLVVPLQNGLPFWYFPDRSLASVDPGGRLASTFAREQLMGAVVHTSGNVPEPGVVQQMGGRRFLLGELEGGVTPRLQRLCALFERAGLEAPPQENIRREVWRKLLGNVSLNPVSALTRSSIGPMLADPGTRALVAAIMRETAAVARAAGCDPHVDVEDRIAYAARLTGVKTSMLQDVEAGRELELEPIVGAVVELAAGYGLEIPHTRTVYALAKRLERAVLDA